MAGAGAGRLRRASTIVCYWRGKQLVFENYFSRRCITADPAITLLLSLFDRWCSPAELFRGASPRQIRKTYRIIDGLTQHTFLLREGSIEAERDACFARAWKSWLPHAGFFHFGSKDVSFRSSEREIRAMLRRFLKEGSQPSFFKSDEKLARVQLASPLSSPAVPEAGCATTRQAGLHRGGSGTDAAALFRVLLARRTHRKFSRQSLSFQALSQLLFYAWGVTAYARVPLLGAVPLKTSPSGGARHPIEVYVLALRVSGLPAGLYHYLPRDHALERIRAGRVGGCAVRYCAGQRFTANAAALFIMSAVMERNRWKYRMARAYRVLLTEAGHQCQVFCLVATAIGLAPFCTMALADSAIEQDIGLDGINDLPLYVAGVGHPVKPKANAITPIFQLL